MPDPAIKQLSQILEREHEALIHGDYDVLERHDEERLRLLDEVEKEQPTPEELAGLSDLLERLKQLSLAAQKGMTEARDLLERSAKARRRLETYDDAGKRRVIETPQQGPIRRA